MLLVAMGFFVALAGQPAQAAFLPEVVKACLPVEGRMMKDRTQACHCPPPELCGTGRLPIYQEGICCDGGSVCKPERCDFGFRKEMNSHCKGCAPGSTNKKFSVCAHAVPDFKPSQAPEGLTEEAAEAAVGAFNTCLTSCETPWRNNQRTNDSALAFFTCNYNCRVEFVANVSSALPDEDTVVQYRAFIDKWLNFGQDQVIADDDDNCATFDPDNWRCNDRNRQDFRGGERGPQFLSELAALPTGDRFNQQFKGIAKCDRGIEPVMCAIAIGNDGSCGSCLAPDMEVTLANSAKKEIRHIKAGDLVKTVNGDATVAEVVIKDWPVLTLYSINGGLLELTADHPVMTTTGWRAVDYNSAQADSMKKYELLNVPTLKVGDVLVTMDGEVTIESIEPMETRQNAQTYNLRLEGGDSFYAGGVLVKDN
tara:strand:+ start:307 stop:1578 length:1272 start_codon:yes stop_codon:yes gene_type:complete